MTERASIRQADIKRAVKAVKDTGLPIAEVKVSAQGEIRVICQPHEDNAKGWDE